MKHLMGSCYSETIPRGSAGEWRDALPKRANGSRIDEKSQMRSGLPRHRRVSFHPSVQNWSTFQLIYHYMRTI
jgi:hypothetical protein